MVPPYLIPFFGLVYLVGIIVETICHGLKFLAENICTNLKNVSTLDIYNLIANGIVIIIYLSCFMISLLILLYLFFIFCVAFKKVIQILSGKN